MRRRTLVPPRYTLRLERFPQTIDRVGVTRAADPSRHWVFNRVFYDVS